MLNLNYFGPLKHVRFFPGVYATPDHRDADSSRFICSYADGKRHKDNLFALMKGMGQTEDRSEWDLHHIVEGQHYADIDFRGELEAMYEDHLPCVYIHRIEEHQFYTRLARTSATKEIFLTKGLPRTAMERSKEVAQEAKDPQKKSALLKRVDNLSDLYRGLYTGDPILQTIALNVLKEAKTCL